MLRTSVMPGLAAIGFVLAKAFSSRPIGTMTVYELLWAPDIPPKAVINEAIEIAKKFGTTESSRFINGMLDRILREQRATSA